MSDHQKYRTLGALPRAPTPLYSQYLVLWFEHGGIVGQFGISELVKFLDDNTDRKTPKKQKPSPRRANQSEKNGVELNVNAWAN